MTRVLILGGSGQVSTYLQMAFANHASSESFDIHVWGSDKLDLSNTDSISPMVEQSAADIIINAAAYTAVDNAETDIDAAFAINARALVEIGAAAKTLNATVIHYSTDYVFDGTADQPYREISQTNPIGVYGQSKLAGEEFLAKSGCSFLILRTAWVYSQVGKNFYKTMIRLAEDRDRLTVVADQVGCPTFAGSIADATLAIIESLRTSESLHQGIYHLCCAGEASWCEFAREIFSENNLQVEVEAITSDQYPTPVKRPAYSVLDCSKLAEDFGIRMPTWQQGLRACCGDTVNS